MAGRAFAPRLDRFCLSDTFELPLPAEARNEPEARDAAAQMLERLAASRPGLLECHLSQAVGTLAAQIEVTLHEDGLGKQDLLVALEEIKKVRRLVVWGLESLVEAAGTMSDIAAMMEQTQAFAGEVARLAEGLPAAAEAAPAGDGQAANTAVSTATLQAPGPRASFCANCGRALSPEDRFCTYCGTRAER
ncbi:MAG: zinc ribbon domain-containing protein [Dehalococcoidales bacterium]|nr:zinc ribbon domain-containing protein [Dehalococcoidales bacterium]